MYLGLNRLSYMHEWMNALFTTPSEATLKWKLITCSSGNTEKYFEEITVNKFSTHDVAWDHNTARIKRVQLNICKSSYKFLTLGNNKWPRLQLHIIITKTHNFKCLYDQYN